MNRLCIFVHFDRDNLIDDYILFFLEQLKLVSASIIFVTTSQINKDEIYKLEKLCDKVIIRENQGYDFVSWQKGLEAVTNLSRFDELILCNDSVYGPIYPLPNIFDTMSSKDSDFWGITDSYEIAYHIQSYFLVFKKSIINSIAFKKFWNEVKVERNKKEIIKKYEVGLTQYLISAGFKPCAYLAASSLTLKIVLAKTDFVLRNPLRAFKTILFEFRQRVLNYRALSPPHYLWKDLIVKYKMPFLKIELLRDNPFRVNIKGYEEIIQKYSNYDTNLINKHLDRMKLGMKQTQSTKLA